MDESLKSQRSLSSPKPTEAEIVLALVEIDQASKEAPTARDPFLPVPAAKSAPPLSNAKVAILFIAVLALIVVVIWGAQTAVKEMLSSAARRASDNGRAAMKSTTDTGLQVQAEEMLGRAATGDVAATDQVLERSGSWTGKTQTTPESDQAIGRMINLKDVNTRAAGLQAQLALNGITRDLEGFKALEQAAENPEQRAWALWLLGALGNRNVDPVHVAKIMESYLSDPDVNVRSNAVIGLALLGTDETIPMLLDRFRNDPAPGVQELAACGLAESGMYTQAQRLVAAVTLVSWLDDSLLTPQQRNWIVQTLHDISGQNMGADSKAWRKWLDANR